MIRYHGLPITPKDASIACITGHHCFVSFAHPEQLDLAIHYSIGFAVDNGAFSAWRKGVNINWDDYYTFLELLLNPRPSAFQWAIIPDVINGSLNENVDLIKQWPFGQLGAPVWHLHEPLKYLEKLCNKFHRVCLGSSGEYSSVGGVVWHNRMKNVFNYLQECGNRAAIHGLRMMAPRITATYPFQSVDSTNVAQNIGIDQKWDDRKYKVTSKITRARILTDRIEMSPVCLWHDTKLEEES